MTAIRSRALLPALVTDREFDAVAVAIVKHAAGAWKPELASRAEPPLDQTVRETSPSRNHTRFAGETGPAAGSAWPR